MSTRDPLSVSLDLIRALMPAEAQWWIIGSTALYLCGKAAQPRDVDVLGPSDVIEAARVKLGVPAGAPRPDAHFRSTPYFQFRPAGGLEIDFMGDLTVRSGDEWHWLQIESDAIVAGLRVPSLTDQAAMLRRFGREKDRAKLRAFFD